MLHARTIEILENLSKKEMKNILFKINKYIYTTCMNIFFKKVKKKRNENEAKRKKRNKETKKVTLSTCNTGTL